MKKSALKNNTPTFPTVLVRLTSCWSLLASASSSSIPSGHVRLREHWKYNTATLPRPCGGVSGCQGLWRAARLCLGKLRSGRHGERQGRYRARLSYPQAHVYRLNYCQDTISINRFNDSAIWTQVLGSRRQFLGRVLAKVGGWVQQSGTVRLAGLLLLWNVWRVFRLNNGLTIWISYFL